MFVPGRLVQTSCTTELPVFSTDMTTIDAPTPARLLAVRSTSKFPATVGVPLITALVALKA